MKIDSSFDAAFLQLQNGVNNASKAASEVLAAVGSDKKASVEIEEKMVESMADRPGSGGVNVSA